MSTLVIRQLYNLTHLCNTITIRPEIHLNPCNNRAYKN